MEEFKNFNIHSLMRILNKSDYEFEQWLKEKYLCWTIRFCECGRQMTLKKSKIWQCNNRKQHNNKQPKKGYYDGTFFSGSHLSPRKILEFTYYWCRNTHSQNEFQHDMQIAIGTMVDWKSFAEM
ncbi:hypothetical protein ACQ4LE_000241 [Meloidogyne hapla]